MSQILTLNRSLSVPKVMVETVNDRDTGTPSKNRISLEVVFRSYFHLLLTFRDLIRISSHSRVICKFHIVLFTTSLISDNDLNYLNHSN